MLEVEPLVSVAVWPSTEVAEMSTLNKDVAKAPLQHSLGGRQTAIGGSISFRCATPCPEQADVIVV